MLETERLILRRWRAADRMPHARMNADPEVARFFQTKLTAAESDLRIERMENYFRDVGYGQFAVELKSTGAFIGSIGLNPSPATLPFLTQPEMGWRLAGEYWGQGYATEGARRVIAHAFADLRLTELIAYTAKINGPSQRVMERIGMTREPESDFIHPALPVDHELAPHLFYRLRAV